MIEDPDQKFDNEDFDEPKIVDKVTSQENDESFEKPNVNNDFGNFDEPEAISDKDENAFGNFDEPTKVESEKS